MAAAAEDNSSLASKCLDLCQALASQGQEFTFSVTIGSFFSFSLDTRKMSKEVHLIGKRSSPSTLRRNARRREIFLKKKAQPPASSTVPNDSSNSSTICSPQAKSNCQTGTREYHADYGDPPPSDAPAPPACDSCQGPTEWGLTRRLDNKTMHVYHCLEFCMVGGSRLTTTVFT